MGLGTAGQRRSRSKFWGCTWAGWGDAESSTHAAAHTLLRFIGVVVPGGLRVGRVLVLGVHRVQTGQRRAIEGQQSPGEGREAQEG